MLIDLFNSVYAKSDTQILIIFVLCSCMYAVSLYCFLFVTIGRLNLPQDSFFNVTTIAAMISLVAVLLTFTLIQSINTYARVNEAVLSETSFIELLYKRSVYLDNRYTKEITQNTLNYVNHIIDSEWEAMITGHRSDTAQQAFDKLLITVSRASHASDVDQETAWDLSTSFGEVVKARSDRLKVVGNNVPTFFYMSILRRL